MAVRGRRLRQVQIGPFAALFALYLILGVVAVIPRITADGVAYYAETRSLLFDGDLDLANEYAVPIESYSPLGDAGPRAIVPRDLDGSFNHDVNLGIVVLLGPFFLVAHVVAGVLGALSTALGGAAPFAMDGFSPIYVLAVAFGTNALVAAGLGLLAAHLAPLVGRGVAIAAAAAIWLGSSLFYWSTQRPAHAHAPLVAIECLFVVLFLARGRSTRDLLAWLAMGALWGLMISVRPIAGFYAAVPAAYLLVESARGWRAWTTGSGAGQKRARDAVLLLAGPTIAAVMFLAGSLVGRLPQLVFAGDASILGSGYYTDTSYLRTGFGSDPLGGLAALLFDPLQGVAWWVPIVPISLIGLIVIWRRDRLTALACITWTILIWGFAALLEAPARFGGFGLASRHLVEATPVYVIGLAGLLAGIRDVARRAPPRRLPDNPFRLLPLLMTIAIATAVGWGILTQIAGSVVDVGGRPPTEQLGAVVARPQILGRLWYTPAASSAAMGKVEIGGHFAAGILNADPAELATAVLEVGWLTIIGLGAILPMALVGRWLRRRDLKTRGDARRPTSIAMGRPSVRTLGRGTALVAPIGLAGVLILGLVAPVLAQPGIERDGQRLTVRTWDGGGLRRPSGTVTSVTFGASPTGNAVVVPPRATRANSLSDPSTATRGTFAPVGAGREAILVPPDDWDVITDVIVWFGPTFVPHAAAEVAIGPGDGQPAAMKARLAAADLALGAVALRLPRVVREMQDEPILLTVSPVGGAPVPEVSIRGDGSLAWQLRGLRQLLLPTLAVGDDPLLPGMDPFYTLQESTSLVIDEAGARMRIGPWGPEQILRWSDHPGWLLPGPTTLPGTWGDSTAPGPTGEPLVVAVDAPFPISTLTAHAIVTGYANDPAATGRISIESSLDGLAWQSISEGLPATPRRQRALAGQVDPPPSTYRVLVRIRLVGPPGSIGLNALWFDVDLAAPVTAIGTARSESINVSRTAAARDYGPLRIEVVGLAGTANTALRAWGAASELALQGPGTVGGVAIAIALASTAALALRRRFPLVVPVGLAILAAIWVIAAIVTLPRVA